MAKHKSPLAIAADSPPAASEQEAAPAAPEIVWRCSLKHLPEVKVQAPDEAGAKEAAFAAWNIFASEHPFSATPV